MAEPRRLLLLCALPLLLCACGRSATLPVSAGIGPNPALPPPHAGIDPHDQIAPPEGWQAGATPTAGTRGLPSQSVCDGLDHPRWLHVLPNGDVLVAETNGPPQPGKHGLKDAAMKYVQKLAGAAVPSPEQDQPAARHGWRRRRGDPHVLPARASILHSAWH